MADSPLESCAARFEELSSLVEQVGYEVNFPERLSKIVEGIVTAMC